MPANHYTVDRISGGARYEVDDDKARLDLAFIHGFLVRSHWAGGIPLALLERAIAHSLCFGLYRDGRQIGFARVVTDHATFAYLADVFVVADERNRGLGTWLVRSILAHPGLQGLRRWLLGTRDAHRLYRRCGFAEPLPPFAFLERLDRSAYAATGEPEAADGAPRAVHTAP
jgi:GNAT superfamily N-acetyltransferase